MLIPIRRRLLLIVVSCSLGHVTFVLLRILVLVKGLLSHEIGVTDRTVEHDNLVISLCGMLGLLILMTLLLSLSFLCHRIGLLFLILGLVLLRLLFLLSCYLGLGFRLSLLLTVACIIHVSNDASLRCEVLAASVAEIALAMTSRILVLVQGTLVRELLLALVTIEYLDHLDILLRWKLFLLLFGAFVPGASSNHLLLLFSGTVFILACLSLLLLMVFVLWLIF